MDDPDESGIMASKGPVFGLTAGIAVGVARFLREAEGEGGSLVINVGVASFSLYFDDQGFNGAGVTAGPGIGFGGATFTISQTLSINDVVEEFRKMTIPIPLPPFTPLKPLLK